MKLKKFSPVPDITPSSTTYATQREGRRAVADCIEAGAARL
jgi:hypothetical protein